MPFPQGLPWTELRRHVPPRTSGPIPPGDRLQDLPVITPTPTTTPHIRGQHRLDQRPHLVCDHTGSDHSLIIGETDAIIWETRSSTATAFM
jgi:hypothetical protein